MRQETINIYKFNELSDEAKEHARDIYRGKGCETVWTDEIVESLKGLFDACSGVRLADWNLGAYSYSYIKVSFDNGAVEDLRGPRALAWIENNLLAGLRIPYVGKKRIELRKCGSAYYAGKIKPGPFTGYYADEVYLEDLLDSIRCGMTLKDSFLALADKCKSLLEAEEDYQNSNEYIDEHFEANEHEFLESGDWV